jgi:hypothetical protein
MKLAKTSLILLAVQLALVSTIAAKYFYQRLTCPRAWTRTVAYDPELLMRGRYLSVQLMVDGCRSTLPSAEQTVVPRNKDGVPTGGPYRIREGETPQFPARLTVESGRLLAIRIPEAEGRSGENWVQGISGGSCEDFRLQTPVDFYLPEDAASPLGAGQGELWIEVTVPPKGPPRPLQLALKKDGVWRPLGLD